VGCPGRIRSAGGSGVADRQRAHPRGRPPRRRRVHSRRRRGCSRTNGPARAGHLRGDLLRQQPARRRRRTRPDPPTPASLHRRGSSPRRPVCHHLHRPGHHSSGGRQPQARRAAPAPAGPVRSRPRRETARRELPYGRLAPRRIPRQPRLLTRAVGLDVRPRLRAHLRPLPPALARHRPARCPEPRPASWHRRPRPSQGHPDRRAGPHPLRSLRQDSRPGRAHRRRMVALPRSRPRPA